MECVTTLLRGPSSAPRGGFRAVPRRNMRRCVSRRCAALLAKCRTDKGEMPCGKWGGLITEAWIFFIYVNSGKSRDSSRRKSEDAARPLFEQRPGWQREIRQRLQRASVCLGPLTHANEYRRIS